MHYNTHKPHTWLICKKQKLILGEELEVNICRTNCLQPPVPSYRAQAWNLLKAGLLYAPIM